MLNSNYLQFIRNGLSSLREFYDRRVYAKEDYDLAYAINYLENARHFSAIGQSLYYIADLRQMKIVFANGNFKHFFGTDKDLFTGRSFAVSLRVCYWRDFLTVAQASRQYYRYFYEQPIENRPFIRGSIFFRQSMPDGTMRTLMLQLAHIHIDSLGNAVLNMCVITDISHWSTKNGGGGTVFNDADPENPIMLHLQGELALADAPIISPAEMRVLLLLSEGKSSKMVADELYLSEHTVNNHRKNMLRKSGAQNIAELITQCKERGLI